MEQRWSNVVAGVVSFAVGGALIAAVLSRREPVSPPAQLFGEVLTTIHDHYVDSTVQSFLYEHATQGLITSLNDPYAELLVGDTYRAYREQMSGLRSDTSRAPIVSSGVTRSLVHVSAVSSSTLLDQGVGYIALQSISQASALDLRQAVSELRDRGMTSLVLDLRRNPGGLIGEGVQVAELFLDPGDTIAVTRGRTTEHSRVYLAATPQLWPDLPVVLLVNRGTASSAEMIAGALQDHDRATVIGTPTFGKGVVQTTFRLRTDVALKLSTSRWYAPSGRSIQRPRPPQPAADSTPPVGDVALAGSVVVSEATARRDFRSAGGRSLPANAGIVPDLITRAAPVADGERRLLRALGSDLGLFRTAVAGYARDLKSAGRITRERFDVTPAMRREVARRLQRQGMRLTSETLGGASRYVDRELGYAIARESFGESAEIRRRVYSDRQLQVAVALLRRFQTPTELAAAAAIAGRR